MIDLGIRAHDVGSTSAEDLARRIRSLGFDGIQLVLKKALKTDISTFDPTIITTTFQHPYVMMLGAYFNPVHPDPQVKAAGIETFKKHIELASECGIRYVGSETGSLMGSPWGYVEENHNEASLSAVIDVFRDLVGHAKKRGVIVAIEGAYAHVAHTPKRIKTVLDQIRSPHLKVTVDLFNFLNPDNHRSHETIFDECLTLFKENIAIIHLKDYVVEGDTLKTVGLGQGLMAYDRLIPKITSALPDVHLIFEGVTNDQITPSLIFIKSLLERT